MKLRTPKTSSDFISIEGENYPVNQDGIFEVDELRKDTLRRLKEIGITVVGQVEPKPNQDEESPYLTTLDFLTSVKGIGDAYAREIQEEYSTLESIVKAGAEEISYEISGVGTGQAERVIAKTEKVIQ